MYFVLHIKRFLYDNNRRDNYKQNESPNMIKAPAQAGALFIIQELSDKAG